MIKQHAIFVVGADGSGKTETTTRISEILGMPRFKCPSEKQWFNQRSFVSFLGFDLLLPDFVQQTGQSFVSDRGFPCEWVYSRVFGRMRDDDTIDRIIDKWGPLGGRIVVLARRDYSQITDDLVPTDLLPRIHDMYQNFIQYVDGDLPTTTIYTDDFNDEWGDDWATGVAEQVIAWTSRDLLEPRTTEESVMAATLLEIRQEAQALWNMRQDPSDKNEQFNTLAKAYLQMSCGNHRGALETLVGVDRGLLPNTFWNHLGMSW